jgi:5-methylcytosine-specific restriction enzyme A
METFLLTWNPRRFFWDSLPDAMAELEANGLSEGRWSSGNTRRIRSGDRVFLIRLGKDSPGLVGSGWAASSPYPSEHWEDQSDTSGPVAWYILVDWDYLSEHPVIERRELDFPPFDAVHWRAQGSGITIQPDIAAALEERWSSETGLDFAALPDQRHLPRFEEGGLRRVTVNRYERDGRARKACVRHYGFRCAACEQTLQDRYGTVAANFIHVHHLNPLSGGKKTSDVDAVRDLRPVCPNCHAIIHLRTPPFSIDEVRGMLVRP